MRKHIIGSTVCLGLFLSVLLLFVNRQTLALQNSGAPPQALVLSDLGSYQNIVATMVGLGWGVTTADTIAVEMLEADGALAAYDVVWVPADANYAALRLLVRNGNALESFARQGGVVVIWGLSPETFLLDIAPGGADAAPLPAGGAGPVAVTAPSHPLFSGGVVPTAADLDPSSTGGGGCLLNTPDGCPTVVIAENTAGPVLLHYRYRLGHVVIGALADETAACREHILGGIESISQ